MLTARQNIVILSCHVDSTVNNYHHGHESTSTTQVFYLLSNITFDVLFNHILA